MLTLWLCLLFCAGIVIGFFLGRQEQSSASRARIIEQRRAIEVAFSRYLSAAEYAERGDPVRRERFRELCGAIDALADHA